MLQSRKYFAKCHLRQLSRFSKNYFKKICDLDFCFLIKKIIGIFPYQLQSLGAGVNSGVTKDVTTSWVGCYFMAGYHKVSRLPTYTPM